MDSTINTNIAAIISGRLDYYYNWYPTATDGGWHKTNAGGAAKVQGAQLLGYAGAAAAFFFSISGAFQSGSYLITYMEKSFWDFLVQFQTKDKYINTLEDGEKGDDFKAFMESYATDVSLLMVATFWHVFFIIGMGTISSMLLFFDVNAYSSTTDVSINLGWKLFVIGCIVGSTNLIAGKGLSVNQETILQMSGFSGSKETENSITQTTVDGADTWITTIDEVDSEKKDFYYMFSFYKTW